MDITSHRIKETRLKKGYTLDDFAEKTGISRTTLHRYENDSSSIPSARLLIISDVLDVSPAYLMGWEDEELIDYDFIDSIFSKLGYELEYADAQNEYFFIKKGETMGYYISPSELNKVKEDILNYTEFKLISIQNELDKKRKELEKKLSNSNSEEE